MDIINSIEDGEYEKATKTLQAYKELICKIKNTSRASIEEQFCIFMELQIIRCADKEKYNQIAEDTYKTALMCTVSNVEIIDIENRLMSPLELNIFIEYISRKYRGRFFFERLNVYKKMILYVEDGKYGKWSRLKVYPKIVVYMYRELNDGIKKLEHKINQQIINGMESINNLRTGKITSDEHISNLINALEKTIKLDNIIDKKKVFITTEELTLLCSISSAYKELQKYEEAQIYSKIMKKYMDDIEEQKLIDGRIGIYEMVMEYIANLLGDLGMFDESNEISHKLIKISLKLRRASQIHPNLYNIAWNNNECEKSNSIFNAELSKCIIFSQLTGDVADESFYRDAII